MVAWIFPYAVVLLCVSETCLVNGLLLEDNNYSVLETLNNLTVEVERLKSHMRPTVAFQAFLSQELSGERKQTVVFDEVVLNIGNGYKVLHGNFVAPVGGTYLFTVHVCSGMGHSEVLDLMLNGHSIGRVLTSASDNHECNTGTWVKQLNALDDVSVSTGTYGDLLYVNPSYGKPNFLGVLLSA